MSFLVAIRAREERKAPAGNTDAVIAELPRHRLARAGDLPELGGHETMPAISFWIATGQTQAIAVAKLKSANGISKPRESSFLHQGTGAPAKAVRNIWTTWGSAIYHLQIRRAGYNRRFTVGV
jgi:hypothetical protein